MPIIPSSCISNTTKLQVMAQLVLSCRNSSREAQSGIKLVCLQLVTMRLSPSVGAMCSKAPRTSVSSSSNPSTLLENLDSMGFPSGCTTSCSNVCGVCQTTLYSCTVKRQPDSQQVVSEKARPDCTITIIKKACQPELGACGASLSACSAHLLISRQPVQNHCMPVFA